MSDDKTKSNTNVWQPNAALAAYRAQFSRTEKIHLNNAGLSPIPLVARDRIQYWAERYYQEGFYTDRDYHQDLAQSRASLAKLVGCEASEIAYFQSTSGGVSQVAFGFGLRAQDEVLIWDQEYSSNLYPWQAACDKAGAKLVLLPSLIHLQTPVETLLEACTERTKIIALSWVQYQTGARSDIAQLGAECRRRGIFLFVDVIQGLGLHEFDFKNWQVDAVAGGSHKRLTGPVGAGFLALKLEHQARFKPVIVGSGTYGTCDDPAMLECLPKRDATRFEAGSKQILEITALGACCELIARTGVQIIEAESLRLTQKLRAGIEELGLRVHAPFDLDQHATAMVNFSGPRLEKIKLSLQAHPVNFAMRGPGLRLSPHAHNTDQDIETALSVIRSAL